MANLSLRNICDKHFKRQISIRFTLTIELLNDLTVIVLLYLLLFIFLLVIYEILQMCCVSEYNASSIQQKGQ